VCVCVYNTQTHTHTDTRTQTHTQTHTHTHLGMGVLVRSSERMHPTAHMSSFESYLMEHTSAYVSIRYACATHT
jgi:hypothetical protein